MGRGPSWRLKFIDIDTSIITLANPLAASMNAVENIPKGQSQPPDLAPLIWFVRHMPDKRMSQAKYKIRSDLPYEKQ